MPILNCLHLLEQAERLISSSPAGVPRQVDLRRAISSAYYGVFHAVSTAAADQVMGSTKRNSPLYSLVYRSIDHKTLRDLCNEARRQRPSVRYERSLPATGFGSELKAFGDYLVELQEKRHSADYDPGLRVKAVDARLTVTRARRALDVFAKTASEQRQTFLMLLLFPPR